MPDVDVRFFIERAFMLGLLLFMITTDYLESSVGARVLWVCVWVVTYTVVLRRQYTGERTRFWSIRSLTQGLRSPKR